LQSVPEEFLSLQAEEAVDIPEALAEPERSLLLWLLKLLDVCLEKSDVNKMTPENLGNLWKMSHFDN
jgi:hypothetical protein